MVLSRNDKRKRKEGDLVDLMEPLTESPKRTKVHAQRKFAQGATTVFNPTHTPVKDKEKSKPPVITELITHKRPNTEDFLTFLCFRGTSILPPSLNFFNVGTKKEKPDSKSATAVSRTMPDKTPSSSTTPIETQKPDTTQKSVTKVKPIVADKKKVSNPLQKNISKFKSATSTVQALKKKYQEQRLAKQRIKNKFKSSCVMRTRSCTERTILKAGAKLAPRKFLPRIENKRLGLRSSVLPDKTKKACPKAKPVPQPKPKKKVVAKQKTSDTSNSDTSSSSEDEELPSEKSTAQIRRPIQKHVQKKMCTRSKSELRRITRSHSGTVSRESLCRRPTRKTKEAAAMYMEILGRKLVSPDVDNEDNASVESFPELPNTRKNAQCESAADNKPKAKKSPPPPPQSTKAVAKTRSSKLTTFNSTSNKLVEKSKNSKMIIKSKRLLRVQKYCETDSDEESESSVETSATRPVTRRSLGKLNKPVSRHLRSSSKNAVTRVEHQNNATTKAKTQIQTTAKTSKEKLVMKRKREQATSKSTEKSGSVTKTKDAKTNKTENSESEEETLGMLLNKLKRKKDENEDGNEDEKEEEKEEITVLSTVEEKETTVVVTEEQVTKLDMSKVSDDEESFRGFTKKAITNVLNTCQTHANTTILKEEEPTAKVELKAETTIIETSSTVQEPEKKEETSSFKTFSIHESTTNECVQPSTENNDNNAIPDPSFDLGPQPQPATVEERKCLHEPTIPPVSTADVTLSTLHMRKEKVNMSTEQIEKWLNDSTFAKEESKLEMESVSNYRYDLCEKKADISHLSISTKIHHLVRPVNVTLSKLTEKSNHRERSVLQAKLMAASALDSHMSSDLKHPLIPINRNKFSIELKDAKDVKNRPIRTSKDLPPIEEDTLPKSDNSTDGSAEKKSAAEKKSIFQPRKPFLPKVKERKTVVPNANAFSPENESSVYAFESDTETPVSTPFRRKAREQQKSGASNVISETETPKVEEQVAKTLEFLEDKDKEREKEKDKVHEKEKVLDNEKERELEKEKEKEKIKENERIKEQDKQKEKEKPPEVGKEQEKPIETIQVPEKPGTEVPANKNSLLNVNKFELPKSFGTLANVQVLPLDKLTTSWSNVNCSASIAVQVNLDETIQDQEAMEENTLNQQKSTEISTQTENNNENDDENDGQLFYIPLQAVTRGGPNLVQGQQLIQGVAVKLGTEGPNGPNQKVLLRAKLVTKPPSSIARCPPVGTVQPTTRTPPSNSVVTALEQQPLPSTSSSTTTVVAAVTEPQVSAATNADSNTTLPTPPRPPAPASVPEKITKSPKAARERKMSVDSSKNGKRCPPKSKQKNTEVCSPTNNVSFPNAKGVGEGARLVEAPTFHPSEKDFQDPLEYIDKIRPIAEKFGICRVVPPPNFKPECKVSDDMRFTAYNQYVHRMLHRWGPNVKEMMAIKKYLATQSITLTHPPWIGGMEVDLPHLYQTVQSLGGLKEVIEKKKWQKVADGMKIPKSAQDRVTKLDDIYCKYLLPYDTLSPEERGKLFDEVEAEWLKRESKVLQRQNAIPTDNDEEEDDDSSDEIEECIVKGRNMPLNAFYRIARNTQRMWFSENQRSGNEAEGASADEVENAFWKHVAERKRHVCVHAASIDSSGRGFGFSVAKNSPFARHPWNLKVLTNNAGSVLRALGPIMGVTVPTLHVGMLFSACCWYRDPHGLPWIEYLHTGAKKIWYGIPDEHNNNFRQALSKMVPRYCKNKTIWLPSDTAMVPPDLLVSNGVSLCQTVQEPGQFIIVFPKAFTSSICTGYVVSESVYFAQLSWLETAEQVFKDIQDSCEPSIFSFERLLFNIINDSRSHIEVLKQILPSVTKIREKEINYRKQLGAVGLMNTERLPLPDSGKRKKGKKVKEDDGDFECETCRANLFVSLVNNSQDDSVYCLPHALQLLTKKKQILKHCTLMYTYNEDELDELIQRLEDRIEAKSKKTNQIKQAK